MTQTAPPTISVILPFYNASATLEEALESVADQQFRDYEVIAVDDGSEDGGAALVEHHARRDRRIRLLRPGRRGLVSALNLGLKSASAPLIARMDADDRMHPERLATQHRHMAEHPELTLAGTRVRLFPDADIQSGFRAYMAWQERCLRPEDIAEEIYVESPIVHPSMIYRRQAVLALGGYREGMFPEDYDLVLRLHHTGHRMAKLDRVLLEWRESEHRLSRTDPRCSRTAFDRLRATFLRRDPRLRGRHLAIWGAGRKTRRRVQLLLDYGHRPVAWIDIDPRKVGNRLNGVPVVDPEWLMGRRPRPFVLSYVANHGARDLIAWQLEAMGYRRGHDYLMVG